MSETFDCQDPAARAEGIAAAQVAVAAKSCVVIPTDTVYGIGADAFSPQAVATLLAAKGRGRQMPPPVLIPRLATLDGLATDVPEGARALAERFWPGALTLILHAQPSLTWDLGETRGTVALRMPDDAVARELLDATGPLAVSSANRTGVATGPTAADAREQLADSVAVYLEDGQRPAAGGVPTPSTIVDYTTEPPLIRRLGALSLETLREVAPSIVAEGN
ncbi:threonylcarbamoyl-AMP synthase [Galactobacter valiniphilus]|uniref:L-threonylcarbamoyladenylate synthase n=1 Tax=Galactobacter valiniphilus TaxID=2676122 RepID=A0A399JAV1_9MICC|nr:threonylcarbamoyl-AMP synthase [Galactobacter valiniphilus]